MIYSYAPFLFKGDMMKKENIWLIISILLVIIWMVSVFKLSSEVSEVSGNRSGGFISSIIRFFNNDISEDKLEKLTESLQPFVRKCAHFCLYAIGGFLIYNLVNCIFKKYNNKYSYKNCILISIFIGVIYAITDELHQLFVSGRSGELRDVFIDSCGIILGVAICYLLIKFIYKKMVSKSL